MEYKYPYIPKEYYAAVMFACKIIREKHSFAGGINTAAKYYGVDKDELERHVRARQTAGRQGKPRGKYKYYVAEYTICERRLDCFVFDKNDCDRIVIKALNWNNAKKHYLPFEEGYAVGRYEEFDTKAQAENRAKEWKAEYLERKKRQ